MTFDRYAAQARAAIEEWESLGAPVQYRGQHPDQRDPRSEEQTRASIRSWADGEHGVGDENISKNILSIVLDQLDQAAAAAAITARAEAMAARHRREAIERDSIIGELRVIREQLGLTQAEMTAHLNLNPGTINNAENRQTSYSEKFLTNLLEQYRVAAKLAGQKAAPTAKAKASA